MICEIGAFLHKGEGVNLIAHFKADKRVFGVYVEPGRTDDLFKFREFGAASENDIVTLIVDSKHVDKIFSEVESVTGVKTPQRGLIYQMPLHRRVANI